MARTTIALELIELIKVGKADKELLLRHLADASSGAEQLRRGTAAVTVTFHSLRQAKQLAEAESRDPARAGMARGTMGARTVIDPIYDATIKMPLYRLTDDARVDVLRFGRHPDQDVQLLDPLVSREHGLVIFSDRVPMFCDYGTLIKGAHAGSLNGTYLDGHMRVRDAMIPWLPGQVLMLGHGPYYDRGGAQCFSIKITYELHPPGDDGGN